MKNQSLSDDEVLNNNTQNKVELVNCPHTCTNCKLALFEINRLFDESLQYQINKEYQFSVISLRKAFEKTYELIEPLEKECANLFRIIILKSLENVCQELKRMSNGFLHRDRYKRSYNMTAETLKEFKKIFASGEECKELDSSDFSNDKMLNLPAV